MSEENTRLYELGFILVPTTAEHDVPEKVEGLKALITNAQGTIVSEGTPEYIDLAYTMERTLGSKKNTYSQGYFGFIKFEVAPDMLESLKKGFDMHEDLIRYLLIKTSPQNTIVFKKPKVEAKRGVEQLDEEVLDDASLEDGTDEVSAHEALPDLAPDIETTVPEEEKESE